MTWLCLQSNSETKLAPLADRSTIGSAESNSIRIQGKGVQLLHGQFLYEDRKWKLKQFTERQLQTLSQESPFTLGAWQAEIGEFHQLWPRLQAPILESFKRILKDAPERTLEDALLKTKTQWFLTDELPMTVKDVLSSQFWEASLRGPIEALLSDPSITDILVERYDRIFIERQGELKLSQVRFASQESYQIYLENLLSQLMRSIDESSPFLDFVLSDGSRGHLIIPPVTDGQRYLSIRKKPSTHYSLNQLEAFGMLTSSLSQKLRHWMSEKKNILVSGATGSGKTTILKALIAECSPSDRVLVLEDTPELKIERPNTAFLCTRLDAQAKLPPVSLRDLVRQSLRMRPDRLVIGETRGDEALDLLQAMNTGHRGCMSSVHANSTRDALLRFQGLIQMSSASLSEEATRQVIARNIQILIHCERLAGGTRKIVEVSQVCGLDQAQILLENFSL